MLMDKRPVPTFPKWVAYVTFATAAVDGLGSFVAFPAVRTLGVEWPHLGLDHLADVGHLAQRGHSLPREGGEREWDEPESELYAIAPGTPNAAASN